MMALGALNEDFLDLLEFFVEEEVEFVIVGAHALAAAGITRATKDIDILVRPSRHNASRVFTALQRFGAPVRAHGVMQSDFEGPGMVYQLGLPPRRIDITTQIDGVDFDSAIAGRTERVINGVRLPFLGVTELVANKRAVGRTRDKLDIELLREAGLYKEP